MSLAQIAGVAVNPIGKAAVLAARWAAANRRRGLEAEAGRTDGDREKELVRWSVTFRIIWRDFFRAICRPPGWAGHLIA